MAEPKNPFALPDGWALCPECEDTGKLRRAIEGKPCGFCGGAGVINLDKPLTDSKQDKR